ncbi:MAG TPA: cation:dicarboxylase symporter family transporter [Gemmatimonadales bacterium]|jgi:proton glutamate symport protein|nr:cation:dicarboxylase symporter family transporter [Gemmatimonadales bacterium]
MKQLWSFLRRISLTKWILIAMVIGALIGWLNPDLGTSLKPLSTVFLRLIKSIVVPIIFGSLVIGIAGHGDDMKRVGRLALKSIIYFEIVTTIALVVGLVAVNLTRPGVGIRLSESAQQGQELAQKTTSFGSFLEHIVPQSFFEAAASNQVLQIVVFAIIFAVALSQVRGRPKETMLAFCEGLAETMFKFTGIVMKFAPIGIGAAIAVTVGHSGIGVLVNLGKLVLTLYGALVVFILVALVPVAIIARVPIRAFIQMVREPALIAFATTSSDAALPKAMENMERLGVSRRIAAFVIPTGYSFNLDGSTLYLAVASIFVAQAAGVDLSVGQQIIMMLTLMVTSKGVAGVPRASLVILSATLLYFDLPLEAVAIILGVDELMDMGRTTVNVIGNCLAAVVMGRWEGEFNPAASLAGYPIPTATSSVMAPEHTGS